MINSMLDKISYIYNRYTISRKFRHARKKHGAISFRVGSVIDFLAELDLNGICYVVLRWPDMVPLGPNPEITDIATLDAKYGDVDILVDLGRNGRKIILDIGARYFSPRGVQCEFYSTLGSGGFSYKHFPYFPPLMSRDLLSKRHLDLRGFYRLTEMPYITSLVYHIIYHKAAAICKSSKLSDKTKLASYIDRLYVEAKKEGVSLPLSRTLDELHTWLVGQDADMPFDLKVRWPHSTGWLASLVQREVEQLDMGRFSDFCYFCIFILRDDLENAGLVKQACCFIGQHFVIRKAITIPVQRRIGLAAHLRGGNWMEGRSGEEILPCTFLICDDLAPKLLEKPIPQYPHLDNANLLLKQKLRNELSDIVGQRLYGIHSSDNVIEAAYIYKVLNEQGFVE